MCKKTVNAKRSGINAQKAVFKKRETSQLTSCTERETDKSSEF